MTACHPSRPIRAVAALCAALLAPAVARASQYPLDQVRVMIPSPDAKRLRKAGIRSTLDLLARGRTPAERKLLADRTALPPERIDGWVAMADLMRVRGIGPDVARLLTAVGVRTLADLQRCDPVGTAVTIKEVNQQKHLSQNPPGAQSIGYWVQQSRKLPIVLEPTP